jgi:hypothetical protein
LYCDENGTIFVADYNNHRVTILNLWWLCCCVVSIELMLIDCNNDCAIAYKFVFCCCFIWISCNYLYSDHYY